jgi:hypothetical protein
MQMIIKFSGTMMKFQSDFALDTFFVCSEVYTVYEVYDQNINI